MPPTKKKPDGIRVTYKGRITTRELRDQLLEAVKRLENNGVTHVYSTNLYVSPCDAQGNAVRPHLNGHPLKAIILDPPYRSAADEHGI